MRTVCRFGSSAELFAWEEPEFNERLAGSAIRRIGHACWLRNLAVGLGNAPTSQAVVTALQSRFIILLRWFANT